MNNETKFHSGFVALVGRPNVGKSTLMNALLGEKISIVSAHAQTTRNKITGVWNGENSQVVFLDTPGMHKPQSKLGEVIRQNTMDALDEVDLIVFLCAVNDPLGAGGDRRWQGRLCRLLPWWAARLYVRRTDRCGRNGRLLWRRHRRVAR